MTFRASVNERGQVQLGDAAARAGFAPGVMVDVILTCSGSLIIAIDQSPPPMDATFRPLTGRAGAALAQLQSREPAE